MGAEYAVSRKTPRGLPNPVATFARTSVSPTPTLQCREVRSRTADWMSRAYASGSPPLGSACPAR